MSLRLFELFTYLNSLLKLADHRDSDKGGCSVLQNPHMYIRNVSVSWNIVLRDWGFGGLGVCLCACICTMCVRGSSRCGGEVHPYFSMLVCQKCNLYLLFVCVQVLLHLWVMFILLAYKPEIHTDANCNSS